MKKLSLFISFAFILGLSTSTWAEKDAPARDIAFQTRGNASPPCGSGSNKLEESDKAIVGTAAQEEAPTVKPAETGAEEPPKED